MNSILLGIKKGLFFLGTIFIIAGVIQILFPILFLLSPDSLLQDFLFWFSFYINSCLTLSIGIAMLITQKYIE